MKNKTPDPGSPFTWIQRTLTILLCTFMVVMAPLEVLLPGQMSATLNNSITANAAGEKTGPFVIVLDPGHDNTHSRYKNKASGIVEEDYNYKVAKSLKSQLESYGFTVYLTRNEKCPLSGENNMACLEYRTLYAESVGCDLYISLHLNAAGANDGSWRSASGSSVYITNYSKYTKTTKSLASYVSKSLRVVCGFPERTPNGIIDINDNGYKYADGNAVDSLKVIRLSSLLGFPSILIEHGFMDNKKDVDRLKKLGAETLAKADCSAIVTWYQKTYGGLPTAGSAAYVNNDILHLRSKASKSSTNIVTLEAYDSLTITGTSGSWYKVRAKHKGKTYNGYVYSSYVKKGAIPITKIENPDKNSKYDAIVKAAAETGSGTGSGGSKGTGSGSGTGSSKGTGTSKGTTSKGTATKTGNQSASNGFVRYEFLNLREKASAKSKLIVKLDQYDALSLLKSSGGWYQVTATHKGKTYSGYVSAEYVETGKTGPLGYVNYDYLNVRKGIGTSTAQIDKLYKHDIVMIMDQKNGWYQIKYVKHDKVQTGYVKASYITKK